jgi:ABC-2 type transport system permease protein
MTARLGPGRLEWLRLIRTPRLAVLAAVYGFSGLLGPVLARYMGELVKHAKSNVTITVGPPSPVDGITNFISQANQIGLVVVVVVAAGALAFDARRGLSTFLRTRTRRMWRLVLPRFAASSAAAVAAYTLGTLAAWYETTLLIGALPVGGVALGLLCGSVYLVFAVAVTAAAASLARSVLGTVGVALGFLLLLPVAGVLPSVHSWLPSSLAGAPVDLVAAGGFAGHLRAVAVALVAAAALLGLASHRLQRREI